LKLFIASLPSMVVVIARTLPRNSLIRRGLAGGEFLLVVSIRH
jgi:hypothetical protein